MRLYIETLKAYPSQRKCGRVRRYQVSAANVGIKPRTKQLFAAVRMLEPTEIVSVFNVQFSQCT